MLIPTTVDSLVPDEPVDGALHVRIIGAGDRHQAHGAPGGLARCGFADPFEGGIFVAVARFTEAAVGFLHRPQPLSSAGNVPAVHALLDSAQAGKDLPGAVDVIHAPAAPPAPF